MKKVLFVLSMFTIVMTSMTACKKQKNDVPYVPTESEAKQLLIDIIKDYKTKGSSNLQMPNLKMDSAFADKRKLGFPDSLYLKSDHAYFQYGNYRQGDALYVWPMSRQISPSNAWKDTDRNLAAFPTQLSYDGSQLSPTEVDIVIYFNGEKLPTYLAENLKHVFSYLMPWEKDYVPRGIPTDYTLYVRYKKQ